ncbi:methionyl-tRNA formyltransferase [Vagococcus salmoninarum]|uniref:Methionyl-tRNA formyltransferase n=1 Tax=Vagococcus salmoninarum TaxID=2739 RepID=A0A429ZQV7_9ENTE|nr:methionyl-tRNA formyltransferase [Vagococcus salmoninarum]MBE9387700.1 methionyl-tRNA formyltransferase [Vagococcus salmoninarum]RST96093.1 methionyl-tRNA formyltransferase [Vagococcus salmoninarum]
MTKIVFMGTPAFSVPILDALVAADYEVVAVVTQPDRPVGRKRVLTPPPVKVGALKHGLEILQPEKISGSPEMERIIALEPDLIVTAAFGQFLPEKLLQAPKFGAINVHASLLPKYRGGAPVHYAIMNGESETGVTIMEMIKKMDAGDIISQGALPITATDDVGSMFDKLSALGTELLLATLPDYLAGKITPQVQNEAEVTFSPNISREEEAIDWQKTAEMIDSQIRGMRPWPVAYTMLGDNRWKLFDVAVSDETTTEEPGTIIDITKKDFAIACGDGTVLRILRLQPAGKGQLSAQEFINGVGQNLEIGNQVN